METKAKLMNVFMIVLMLCLVVAGSFLGTVTANAQTVDSEYTVYPPTEDGAAEPYALFVDVALGLNGGNGEVWSIAQTKSAILATTIQVVLELYSSDTYQDSYKNMTLEKRVNASNLKKGESIKAVVSTNGVQKYWRGRMYYKADSAGWKFGETQTLLLDANGILVL